MLQKHLLSCGRVVDHGTFLKILKSAVWVWVHVSVCNNQWANLHICKNILSGLCLI